MMTQGDKAVSMKIVMFLHPGKGKCLLRSIEYKDTNAATESRSVGDRKLITGNDTL